MAICDTVTVFKDGRDIATVQVGATSSAQLIQLMLGSGGTRPLSAPVRRTRPDGDAVVLEVGAVTEQGRVLLDGLVLRRGEVLGALGLPGWGARPWSTRSAATPARAG